MMVDEAHERTLHTDVLFGLVKDIARFRWAGLIDAGVAGQGWGGCWRAGVGRRPPPPTPPYAHTHHHHLPPSHSPPFLPGPTSSSSSPPPPLPPTPHPSPRSPFPPRPDLKLLISSATLDAEKFSEYFDYAPIFRRARVILPASFASFLPPLLACLRCLHRRPPPHLQARLCHLLLSFSLASLLQRRHCLHTRTPCTLTHLSAHLPTPPMQDPGSALPRAAHPTHPFPPPPRMQDPGAALPRGHPLHQGARGRLPPCGGGDDAADSRVPGGWVCGGGVSPHPAPPPIPPPPPHHPLPSPLNPPPSAPGGRAHLPDWPGGDRGMRGAAAPGARSEGGFAHRA